MSVLLVRPLLATDVGSIICTDTTWTLAGSPYIVTGSSVTISCNAALTIEPGVVVKFDYGLALVVGENALNRGTLVARGNEESPIIFTTAGEPNLISQWDRIYFTDYAVDANLDPNGNYINGSILEHVIVESTGLGVYAEQSAPFLNHCTIHTNGKGLRVTGENAPGLNITNCTMSENLNGDIDIWNRNRNVIKNNSLNSLSLTDSNDNLVAENVLDGYLASIKLMLSNGNTLTKNVVTNSNPMSSAGGIDLAKSHRNVLTNNTVTNGNGILLNQSNYNTLTENIVNGNHKGSSGGGIDLLNSNDNVVAENIISSNSANSYGGGLALRTSNRNTIRANIISNNITNGMNATAGAVYFYESSNNVLLANRITNNQTIGGTGGIYVTYYSERLSMAGNPLDGTHNIIRGNSGYQVANNNAYSADGRYDIQAGYTDWGVCDPAAIHALVYDYFDNISKGKIIYDPIICAGDSDLDNDVDMLDMATFVENWLRQDCAIPDWCERADIDLSTNVDFVDFAHFADNWLFGTGP